MTGTEAGAGVGAGVGVGAGSEAAAAIASGSEGSEGSETKSGAFRPTNGRPASRFSANRWPAVLLAALLPGLRSVLLLAFLSAALPGMAGCVEDRGRPPVARLSIEPRYVPAGETAEVLLDGRRSCDEIDHPETCDKTAEGTTGPPLDCPGGLSFSWTLDAPYERVPGEGAEDAPYMKVRITPDRPITVTLRVTDCDHNQASAKTQIGIELPYPEPEPGADAGVP
jgi:hypothetical protein